MTRHSKLERALLWYQQRVILYNVSMYCSTNRQMLLCGMHSGFIRVYPLHHGEQSLKSMRAYWTLSVHDNQYGHLQHIRSSYDDQFVLTAGDDGNIFSFSLLPPEGLQRGLQREMAKIPLPMVIPHTPIIHSTYSTCCGSCLCINLIKI